MITIKNVKMLDDQIGDYTIPSTTEETIEAEGKLLLLPGVIDSHICFGPLQQQTWDSALSSAIKGGITTVIEIPSDKPALHTEEEIEKKRGQIDQRLSDLKIPLHYLLYGQADAQEVEQLGLLKKLIKGIAIRLDPEKQRALEDSQWKSFFQMAAWKNLPVIINAWNENTKEEFKEWNHEKILEQAIEYTEQYNGCLYVLNVATQREIACIQAGRKRSVLIYAETTPKNLFSSNISEANHLWKAIHEGVIETLGSGYHAEDQEKEKILFQGEYRSFSDPIFLLPLLLTACQEGKVTMERLIRLLKFNVHDIFSIDKTRDVVLVDLEKKELLQKLEGTDKTNIKLTGWPVYTIIQGRVFPC